MRRLKPVMSAVYSLSPRLIAGRVPMAAGLTPRNASWRVPVAPPPTGPVLMRGRVLRSRPSARTPSTVMTIESVSWCDQPSDV